MVEGSLENMVEFWGMVAKLNQMAIGHGAIYINGLLFAANEVIKAAQGIASSRGEL